MKKEFLTYEQATQLKELGFDEPTSFYWENNTIKPLPMKDEVGGFHFNRYTNNVDWISAPLKQQVFRWFREKYGYCVSIRKRYFQNVAEVEYNYFIYPPNSNEHLEHNLLDEYESWEEAESACIDDLIKLVKGNGTIDFICPDPNCPHCNYNE